MCDTVHVPCLWTAQPPPSSTPAPGQALVIGQGENLTLTLTTMRTVLLLLLLVVVVVVAAAAADARGTTWAVRLHTPRASPSPSPPLSQREEELALLRTAGSDAARAEAVKAYARTRAAVAAEAGAAAASLAATWGLSYAPVADALPDTYLLWANASVSDDEAGRVAATLAADARVRRATLLLPLVRTTRAPVPVRGSVSRSVAFNDPAYGQQWHLPLMLAPEAWQLGYTGSGVTVAVVDDGVDYTGPDLQGPYRAAGSTDLVDGDTSPMPATGDTHGTRCASEIVATPNNNYCGVGVAYGALLSGAQRVARTHQARTYMRGTGNPSHTGTQEDVATHPIHINTHACIDERDWPRRPRSDMGSGAHAQA
jgi:hypothetical protein